MNLNQIEDDVRIILYQRENKLELLMKYIKKLLEAKP